MIPYSTSVCDFGFSESDHDKLNVAVPRFDHFLSRSDSTSSPPWDILMCGLLKVDNLPVSSGRLWFVDYLNILPGIVLHQRRIVCKTYSNAHYECTEFVTGFRRSTICWLIVSRIFGQIPIESLKFHRNWKEWSYVASSCMWFKWLIRFRNFESWNQRSKGLTKFGKSVGQRMGNVILSSTLLRNCVQLPHSALETFFLFKEGNTKKTSRDETTKRKKWNYSNCCRSSISEVRSFNAISLNFSFCLCHCERCSVWFFSSRRAKMKD